MRGKILAFASLLVLLAACSQVPVDQPIVSDGCEAEKYETLLWKPEVALESVALPKRVRVIPFGAAVTQDYRPNRLNITIGKLGRIERIFCG